MRLLIAEDERELSSALAEIFKRNNYLVDVVNDGLAVFDYVFVNQYDCIILDIMMPKMDGLSVLTKLRQENVKTPIIMLTAKSLVEDKVKGLDSGANDYLAKPFSIKELLARVRVLTRKEIVFSNNIIEYGNTKLNINDCTVSVGNQSEELTSKEFQTLEYLMKNPRRVISLNELYNRIWSDSDSYYNVVWVYISYIRKKLEKLNSNVVIKAKRNIGYSLELI